MALTGITTDVSLEIITYLPLSSIASLLLVQKAWKNLVDSNAANIYRNAAALHRFIQKADTNLADAVAALDFDATPLDIHGWKEFCRLRLDIERNWAGLGPSEMWKLEAFGEQVHHWQSMNDSHTIVSSSFRGLSVFDAYETIWALPLDYLPAPTFFAYDQGYLAFLRPTLNTLEVWREVSDRPFPSKPSSAQKFAATSIVALYGPPDAGHFVPCYMLTCPEGEHISPGKSFKLHYPTLIATTRTRIHMWDVSVGKHLRTLDSKGMLDDHGISTSPRADICDDYVVTFDALQIRVFSRHDGNFLFHFSRKAGLSTYPRAMQLLPPRKGAALMQSQDAVFQKQVLFQKQHKWAYPRGNFNQVGLSPCGTILVALTENNRMIIIPEFQRVVTGEVEIADVAIEVKSGEEYGDLCGHPIVTRDRIAVGTEEGIIIFTIDRSKAGPVPKGSVRFTTPAGTRALPVQLSASCITLEWQGRDRNLSIGGTRLFFGAAPTVVLREPLLRFTRAKRETRINHRVF
ncbi:hypothetical protein DFH07DRAFT_108900 [Mycena maculata]|uniref:F-box domain-containing protein n=1 Tax=Mycena maculata TaxID=230809 RepID=A0AAD7I8E1_9AGAR|nr:hypothetical protein DFH07DRAFT_108900 [Mycena maculata]